MPPPSTTVGRNGFFRKRHAEPAQLGELRPVLGQPAAVGRRDLAAGIERILVAHETLGLLLQLLLLVGKGQIHLVFLQILRVL
jgi:hypothetical protein